MHTPEHHVTVGSALITSYKHACGKINLVKSLTEMQSRGKNKVRTFDAGKSMYLHEMSFRNLVKIISQKRRKKNAKYRRSRTKLYT